MMISVLTCARLHGQIYLPITLPRITAQLGTATAWLFCDGPVPDLMPPPPWQCSTHEGAAWGTRRMLGRVLRHFVEQTDEPRLIYFEDDVVIGTGLLQLMERLPIPDDVALVSLFDPRMPLPPKPQLIRARCDEFVYTQALVFPRRTAAMLVAGVDFSVPSVVKGPHGADGLLRNSLTALGAKNYFVVGPNPVRHVGAISVVWKGLTRVPPSPGYPGDEFDVAAWSLA